MKEDLEESFKGQIIPFGALVSQLPRERQTENSSTRKEGITSNLPRIYFDRGVNLVRRHSDC